jgi:hydrogenase nickel incorporation protein HypA/HybF
MHELAVTQSVLEISLRHATIAKAKRITHLYLVIGQFASIIDDSVQFYWDIITKDTIAANSQLHFKRMPATMACLDCNHQFQPAKDSLSCPSCNSDHIKVVSGDEFYLEAIDIE